MPTLP